MDIVTKPFIEYESIESDVLHSYKKRYHPAQLEIKWLCPEVIAAHLAVMI